MELSGFPYVELGFDADGTMRNPADVEAVAAATAPADVTDALVLVHGWNTDAASARALYRKLAEQIAALGPLPGTVLVGVLWPSTRFADDTPAGGAASAEPSNTALADRLAEFTAALDHPDAAAELTAAAEAIDTLDSAESAQRRFVDAVREALRVATAGAVVADEDTPAALFTLDGAELLERLARPAQLSRPTADERGGAASIGGTPAGAAAGLGIFGGGIRNAARNLLDATTYYLMKERAGTVGVRGLAPVLPQLRAARPGLRLHLVGHSFGARLVSAAATGPAGAAPVPVASMTLLQSAFSHFSFAQNWKPGADGAFRGCLTGHRIDGPVLVTHTANDRAVGIAYALASRIAGQVASAVGGPDDLYGGIGRNGALRTPEAGTGRLLDIDGVYTLRPGKVHNLLADAFISEHSDVTGPQVAHALRSAVAVGAGVG